MKLFVIVAWISGILAVVLMIMGALALIIGENLFGVRHEANYFIAASSLLLLGILCVLAKQGCVDRKELKV
ncbi:MAG TPA: hypothetical protein VHI78_09870 [Bacteroidales bacterium]|jgi:hypothetical protein|nr:hypothetical protein [Bacteroidales bacterium]